MTAVQTASLERRVWMSLIGGGSLTVLALILQSNPEFIPPILTGFGLSLVGLAGGVLLGATALMMRAINRRRSR